MDDAQPFPVWMIPLFPVYFALLWMFVLGVLAAVGGWSELARRYRDPEDPPRGNVLALHGASLSMWHGWMRHADYSRCVTITLSSAGLHLRVMIIFRFRHPPLLIPWEQVEHVKPATFLFWRTLTIQPHGTAMRIRLYGRAARAVEEAWAQRTTASPQAAVV